MRKKITIYLSLLLILFNSCRNESFYNESSAKKLSKEEFAEKIKRREISNSEIDKIPGLNERLSKDIQILNKKSDFGKGILEGAIVDSSNAVEIIYENKIFYTFYVYRPGQKDFIENLLVEKNTSTRQYESFLLRYPRTTGFNYDKSGIEMYPIENRAGSSDESQNFTYI